MLRLTFVVLLISIATVICGPAAERGSGGYRGRDRLRKGERYRPNPRVPHAVPGKFGRVGPQRVIPGELDKPIDNTCGGKNDRVSVTDNSGALASGTWPDPYAAGNCQWMIDVGPNEDILLSFNWFEIARGAWLKVTAGGITYLNKVKGSTMPDDIYIVGSPVLVQFMVKRARRGSIGFHLNFEVSGETTCGDELDLTATALPQSFTSPGYGEGGYTDHMDCAWSISAPEGKSILVDFVDFSVEESDTGHCDYDVVEVYDGDSVDASARLCGIEPTSVKSESSWMYILLSTDESVTQNGFNLTYQTIETTGTPDDQSGLGCGGTPYTSTSPGDEITSPNFGSGNYPYNSHCVYHIVASAGKLIQLDVTTFELENAYNCMYDSLAISDGGSALLEPLCGSVLPTIPLSNTNELVITYDSDSNREYGGFSFTWSEVDIPEDPCEEPGQVLTGESGVIKSHEDFGGSDYDDDLDCRWTIQGESEQQISLKWTDFDIEAHDSCDYDYVAVYDGSDENAGLIGKYCGSAPPIALKGSGSALHIHFHTDYSVVKAGFTAEYHVLTGDPGSGTEDECDGTAVSLSGTTGTFKSPGYDGSTTYKSNADCAWSLSATDGKHIKVTFSTVDMEKSPGCIYDAVTLYDGTDDSGPVSGYACGQHTGVVKHVRSNTAYITFTTDATEQGTGFSATWEEVEPVISNCGTPHHSLTTFTRHNQKIIGGFEVNPHSVPWQIMLRKFGSFICGGSIISKSWILTAAHCTAGTTDPTRFSIDAGRHYMGSDPDSKVQNIQVKTLRQHASYNGNAINYDFSLLELETPLDLNNEVEPICLASKQAPLGEIEKCFTSGWGTQDNGQLASNLQQVYLPIVEQSQCIDDYNGGITDYMICAGRPTGGIDACQGDSGGPLVCLNDQTGSWELHGVTSWGYGCAEPNYPGVYARVGRINENQAYSASIQKWIRDNTNNDPDVTFN